jgi:HPr kinase/phosphorylase
MKRSEYRLMRKGRRLHGSCVSRHGDAILVVGPPGSGKSDLALRLLSRGFELVADDQVDILDGVASCPEALAGLLEVRGLGIVRLPYRSDARLALVVDLDGPADRLPIPQLHAELRLPVVQIDAAAASAADKIILALDCALGRVSQVAGAFAA